MGKSKDSTGTALATSAQKRLDELEATISAGLTGFSEAGAALREIRDAKLYRATHKTFEAYCQDAWGLTHRHANRLVEAASVAEVLGTGAVPTERVARELAPLKDEPEKMIGAWQRAVEEHGKPTAAQVRKIVQPEAPAVTPPTPAAELPAPADDETVEIPASEVEVDAPIAATATAKPVKRKELEAGPKAPTRSPSTLASFTRAFNAALADGWSLREISEVMDRVYRERDA